MADVADDARSPHKKRHIAIEEKSDAHFTAEIASVSMANEASLSLNRPPCD
jgi:hypothetical protein